jgi:methyl-accepting chemotaxis protein
MTTWTIGKRLAAGFAAVVMVMIVVGGFAVSRVVAIKTNVDRVVNDSLPGTALSGEWATLLSDGYGLTLKFAHAESATEMTQISAGSATIEESVDKLSAEYEKTITQPDDRKNFETIKSARLGYLEAKNAVFAARKDKDAREATASFNGQFERAFKPYDASIDVLTNWNVKAGTSVGEQIAGQVNATIVGVSIGLAAGALVAALLAFFIVRSTSRVLSAAVNELREGSEQVASAAGQVSTSAQSLSQGATEQAASLEETSASMEEMASMTRKTAENSRQAAALMAEVDGRVKDSNAALGDMVASMASIQDSSRQVAKIIKTIDEIAFQTNILALNAAVEAARAGEAGMGFAVVADEVRNLAQRSAQAAKDTAGLIEASIERAHSGNQKVEQVAASISGITDSVVKVKGLVDEVSVASNEQTQGIDQVSQAIAQMEKVTQTTAATAEESAAASEELTAQAETTMSVVAQLEALVVGGAGAHSHRAAAVETRHNRRRPHAPNIVRLPAAERRGKTPPPKVHDELPMDDTGTYGKF